MSSKTLFSSKQSRRRFVLAAVCVTGVVLGRLTVVGLDGPEVIRDHVPMVAHSDHKSLPHFDLTTVDGRKVSCHDVLHKQYAVLCFGSFT